MSHKKSVSSVAWNDGFSNQIVETGTQFLNREIHSVKPIDRRTFVQASTVAAAGLAVRGVQGSANERIRVAVLGVNGRGKEHIAKFPGCADVQVAVLCDPDQEILSRRATEFEKKYGYKVETETDLRRVFARKDIQAVSVATPNHWHALATIWACQAGKDVYVEKPGSHNVFEGRKMVEAAAKYNRIVQHGVQLRSSPAVQEAVKLMKNGLLGKTYMSRGLCYRERKNIGHFPDSTPPSHLDWDLWQGPAQERAFSKRYVHYNWHWCFEYGNGDLGNQGVHETDMCLWGLGLDTMPTEITALGGRFVFDDDKTTPDVLNCSYVFGPQKKMVEFEVRPWRTNTEEGATVGNLFYGTEGYLVVKGYGSFESFLGPKRERGPKASTGDPTQAHFKNFIDAVRSRKKETLNGPIETAHTASALAHLGNIAYRTKRYLKFDPKAERFESDSEAQAMLTRDYRKPYIVPDQV